MITTVTPNPSLDRTLHVASILRGVINRATSETVEPSGKGVNVAVALHAAGRPTTAVLPVAGAVGRQLHDLLSAMHVPVCVVPVHGDTRSNVSVIETDGTTTKFNAPGACVEQGDVDALIAAAEEVSEAGQWVAWCGSLPVGFADTDLARAIAAGRASGRQVALDTSGPALAAVLGGAADSLPHLIKPNAEELAELVDRPLPTLGAVADAARDLVDLGIGVVLVSLGGDGAVLVQSDAALYGRLDAPRVVNTVGAGDAFLAGFLAASSAVSSGAELGAAAASSAAASSAASGIEVGAASAAERLASALRYGAAAVGQAGTLLTDPPKRDAGAACHVVELDTVRDQRIG